MKIVLDPGDGGRDGGAAEAEANLRIALAAASAVRLVTGEEVEVALTRRSVQRAEDAALALADADLAVRIEHGDLL